MNRDQLMLIVDECNYRGLKSYVLGEPLDVSLIKILLRDGFKVDSLTSSTGIILTVIQWDDNVVYHLEEYQPPLPDERED